MTIGDPFLNNSNSIVGNTNIQSINNNNNNNNNNRNNRNNNANNNNNNNNTQHFNRNINFNSSQMASMYHTNREKLSNSNFKSSSSTSVRRVKRRNSESENAFKKIRHFGDDNNNNGISNSIPAEELNLHNINLEEYPKFNHPDGGIIQFTPIGNIRTFISDNNLVNRIIEKQSTFDLNQTDCGIDGYKLYLGSVAIDNSPSNEIESYMINGYNSSSSSAVNNSYYNNPSSFTTNFDYDYDCDSDLDYDDDDCAMN